MLTLEVISANGDALGGNRSKTVGPEGAQIGRSKESDWVINDPYISRVHARIRYLSGTYYVEGTGRNPLALNDPSNVVPNNQPQLLRSGDRFFLDQYEIRVTLDSNERKPPPADPFAQDLDSPTVRVQPMVQPVVSPAVQSWQGPNIQDASDANSGDLDPLKILSAAPRSTPSTPLPPIDLNQRPVVEEHFTPPQPVTRPLTPSDPTPLPLNMATQKIPEQYRPGMTHLSPPNPPAEPTGRKVPPVAPPPPSQSGAGGRSASAIPDRWDTSFMPQDPAPPVQARPPVTPVERPVGSVEARVEPRAEPRVEPRIEPRVEPRAEPRSEPRPMPGINKTINRALQPPGNVAAPREPGVVPPPRHEPVAAPPEPVAAPRETRSLSLEQLLSAAGVPATQMSPELAQELGEALRVVVQGLMEVLQSRAEIKSQLRMNMTLMKPAENNPLKFSPNVEAALHTLLVERNRGYLPTVRAFQEALLDIRNHQLAVLQGIRSAFQSMLEQFNPVRLEQEFERHQRRGLLNVGAKGRFRDAYVETFERLTRDPDESFKRLFGEYFAQAYEQQMEQLKAEARNDAR
jgi:type VI secretion system protein ImpI